MELLAEEPRYLLQLSKDLGLTMPAIQKHLDILHEAGFVTSYEEKSDLAAPPRRYYRLESSFYLSAGITSSFVSIDVRPLNSPTTTVPKEFEKIRDKVENLAQIKDDRVRLRKSDELLAETETLIRRLDELKLFLLNLKRETKETASETIREISETSLERRLLHTVLGSTHPLEPELLSASLEIREKTVEDILKELERRGIDLRKDQAKTRR